MAEPNFGWLVIDLCMYLVLHNATSASSDAIEDEAKEERLQAKGCC
jgi:hypothetical protein